MKLLIALLALAVVVCGCGRAQDTGQTAEPKRDMPGGVGLTGGQTGTGTTSGASTGY